MKHSTRPVRPSRGFTLIEVLVSLIILSIGLLGLGLLQASSLKASFSSNQRTIATNLAHQMIDMMRANHTNAAFYAWIDLGDAAALNDTTCDRMPSTGPGNVIADDRNGWMCQVRRELPGGDADVAYVPGATGSAGTVTITITWTDARWKTLAADRLTTFTEVSQL